MYIQDRFREQELPALHDFMRAHALATLVVTTPRLEAFLMPIEIVSDDDQGLLRGHVVRTNHLWTPATSSTEALVVFQGPNSYISPRWYVNGQRSGRVAPSWNYTTVHASGPIRFIDDAQWVHAHLTSLTNAQESQRENPWHLADAPAEFIDGLLQRLVGIEIKIARLEGKHFLSQQRTPEDRESIVRHLLEEPRASAQDLAQDIERAGSKDSISKPLV
jgi:transcriptional regulator